MRSRKELLLRTAVASMLMTSSSASSVVAHKKVTEDGYSVEVFECDQELQAIPTADRQTKNQGSSYRVCFKPNDKAVEDGVRIANIDYFNWEMDHKTGVAEQVAVIQGDGDGVLSILTCQEDGKLCYLDAMLGANFYVDSGSVLGYGAATLTMGKGQVEMEKFLFPHDFKFTMRNPDGTEMDAEQLTKLKEAMDAQETAAVATAARETSSDESTEAEL